VSGRAEKPYLHRDEDSFQGPLDRALAACVAQYKLASATVKGAEARVRAALDDLKYLREFIAEVEHRMNTRSFHELPRFLRGGEGIHGLHKLTAGPWRGVFLVGAQESDVVALVFSKQPHDLGSRLNELVSGYQTAGGDEG
jgi:hypothetical protein